MKIALFNSYPIWGGGEKWHFNMAKYASEQNHEVYVICHPKGELAKRIKEQLPKVTVIPFTLTKNTYWNPFKQFELRTIFKKINVHSVIFNGQIDVRAAAVVARRAGVKNVIYRNGMPAATPQKKSYIKAFQEGLTDIVTLSIESKDILDQQCPLLTKDHQIKIFPNSIDLKSIRPKSASLPAPKKDGEIILCMTGRLTPQKGYPYLLESIKILKERNLNFRMWIVGDGENKEELLEKAKALNILDKLEFLGFQDNVFEFLQHADIFTFSSQWEGLASSIIEAMAVKLPVVAYQVSSMPEAIINNQTGFLVKNQDTLAFANAVEKLINDTSLRQSFGEKGYEEVLSKYEREANFSKWLQFILK